MGDLDKEDDDEIIEDPKYVFPLWMRRGGIIGLVFVTAPNILFQSMYYQKMSNGAVDVKARPFAKCWLNDFDDFGACATAAKNDTEAHSLGPNGSATFAVVFTIVELFIGLGFLYVHIRRILRSRTDRQPRDSRLLYLFYWFPAFAGTLILTASYLGLILFFENSVKTGERGKKKLAGAGYDYDAYLSGIWAIVFIG